MKKKRNYFTALLISATLITGHIAPYTAVASGIPVFDGGNFAQNIISAVNTVRGVVNQGMQIRNEIEMIRNQVESLKSLDPSIFFDIDADLGTQISQIKGLVNKAETMGLDLGAIENQFSAIFPETTSWASVEWDKYGDYVTKWSEEVQGAAKIAMQAQSVIKDIENSNLRVQNILSGARNAQGEVRQLQSVNSMLGNVSGQLNTLTTATVASNQLTATMAAKAEAQKSARRAALEKFTSSRQLPTETGTNF